MPSLLALLSLAFIAFKANKYAGYLCQKKHIGPRPTLLNGFTTSTVVIIFLALVEFHFDLGYLRPPVESDSINLLPTTVSYLVIVILGGIVVPLFVFLLAFSYWIYLLLCRTSWVRPNLEIIFIAPLLQAALWMLVLQILWEIVGALYPWALYEKLHHHIPSLLAGPLKGYTPYPYFEWVGLRTFSLITLLSAAILFAIARLIKPAMFQRVIIDRTLAWVLSALMMFACIHVLPNSILVFDSVVPNVPWISPAIFDVVRGPAQSMYNFLWPFELFQASPAVLMFVLSFGLEPLRQGLSLVDEVVSYMQFNGAEARRRVQRWFWGEFEVRKNKHDEPTNDEFKNKLKNKLIKDIENRRPIRYCFNHALNNLLHDYNVTHLLIVSHSQGTV